MSEKTIAAEKKLLRGTVVYALGMFANNALSVLLLPLSTRLLTPGEYGYYELALSTITLIVPLVTLQSLEALFRLLFSAEMERKRTYVTIIFCICLAGLTLGGGVFILLAGRYPDLQYPVPIALFTLFQVLYMFYQKIARAEGKNKLFAAMGILQTGLLLLAQLALLLIFHMKADALLLAGALAYAIACVIYECRLHALRLISPRLWNRADLRMILRFSIPLIPNTVSWWLIASLNRYILLGKSGLATVGVYSMALKFSFIVTAMAQVFNMAWQESAITEYQNHGSDGVFFTRAFQRFMQASLSLVLVMIPVTRLVLPYVVGAEFLEAGTLIPPLYLVAVLEAFMTFWSAGYFVRKRTGGAFITTMVGSLVNIALVFCLVDRWGMFAPVVGSMAAFLVIWILRARQLRDVLRIRMNWRLFLLLLFMVLAVGAGYYLLPASFAPVLALAAIACAAFANGGWLLGLWKQWAERKPKNGQEHDV